MKTILASASPRRERLLRRLVRNFTVKPAHINEKMHGNEAFARACVRLARGKARMISRKNPSSVVVGADTAAYLGKRNFRKTDDEKSAREILLVLSGKTHTVATGVAVVFPNGREFAYCERARVKMKKLSTRSLARYLKTGEWKGRAGSYDVSGRGKRLVARVTGEKETVVGLPLKKLRGILRSNR